MGMSGLVTLQTLVFGFVLWFSLYLLQRSTGRKLLYTGLGLGAYALALAFDLLAALSSPSENFFLRLHWGVLILPAIFWTGAMIQLLPDENGQKRAYNKIWHMVILPVSLLLVLVFLLSSPSSRFPTRPFFLVILLGISILPLMMAVLLTRMEIRRRPSQPQRRSLGLILAAALFFALGSGLLFLRLSEFPDIWVVLAIGIDLEFLGFAIVYLDAFEQGETFWPDFLRSFAISALVALLFGGQVAYAIAISTGLTLPMMGLLLTTISLAIFTQVYADPIQAALDRIVFARFPRLRQERAELRGVAAALPRIPAPDSTLPWDEETFARFTRRALSHLSDLPKLAANPLIHLPLIESRLRARNAPLNTLERAAELKTLLTESIARLKPASNEIYGTLDAWRFYNALYYPYVLGLRPYSRRADSPTDPEIQTLLAWFRTTVPERTLHNWQNSAAALIAKDLHEKQIIIE